MDLTPTGSRVIVRAVEEEFHGNIKLVHHEKPNEGIVLAVGPGRVLENGVQVPVNCKVGDRVVFSKYAGVLTWSPEHGDTIILPDKDVLAIRAPKSDADEPKTENTDDQYTPGLFTRHYSKDTASNAATES
jgi:chaperonin GroES